jgi:hypothetical protein
MVPSFYFNAYMVSVVFVENIQMQNFNLSNKP